MQRTPPSSWLVLAVPALLGIVATLLYWPALRAPWYFDDIPAIVENPLVRQLWPALQGLFSRRGLAMASFAVNYRLGGLDPFGYHLVSLALHLGSSCLVFLLLRRVCREDFRAPILGALLFLAHPLQTQSVNYLVQRMTLLSAGLFLLALYLTVRAREVLAVGAGWTAPAHLWRYLGALLAGLLALLSKEIAVVLPLALLLFSRFFLPGGRSWRTEVNYLLPFCLAPLVIAGTYLVAPLMAGRQLVELTAVDRIVSQGNITPLTYLVTEFSVLWKYLRLLFLPYGQALDHSYPLAAQLLTPLNAVALLGLIGLGGLSWWLRQRAPLIAFGIAWFFLTLTVESSILPLDPLFEHRLYLPMFGFTVAVLGLCRLIPRRAAEKLLFVGLAILAMLTWQRNRLWADPVALHEDNLRQAPHSERVRVNLALNYMQTGQTDRAEELLREAIRINPRHDTHYINLSKLLIGQSRYPEALVAINQGLVANPDSVKLHNNLGGLYNRMGDPARAIEHLNRALSIDPGNEPSLTNLGVVYHGLGLWREAERYHRRAIAAFADDPIAHFNLGLTLEKQGRLPEAAQAYRASLLLNRSYPDALLRLGVVVIQLGNRSEAGELLPRLRAVDPTAAARLAAALSGGVGH